MDQPSRPDTGILGATLRSNIARLQERAEQDARALPWSDRLAASITRFTGSMTFVAIHAVVYALWITANLGWLPGAPRFDPSFTILAMEASVEAIFLSTFVLINQNRMAATADSRAKLDLHINLLAEHELTELASVVARIAERVGAATDDPAFHEIRRDVVPEQVLDALRDQDDPSRG